jgi:hypothetical protein
MRARLRSLPVQSKDWLRMLAGCAELNALQRYIETKRRLDTYRNKKRNAADDLVGRWRKAVGRGGSFQIS